MSDPPTADAVPPAVLLGLSGERAGESFPVETELIIGRGSDAQVRLSSSGVSRHHARIRWAQGAYRLEDLRSRNGTRLNSRPALHEVLAFGDEVGVGSARFLFTRPDEDRGERQGAQRLETLGRLAGGIAHEFNNLLGSVLTNLTFLKYLPPSTPLEWPDVSASLEDAEGAVRRAIELTRQLLGFARRGKYQERLVDLSVVSREVVQILKRSLEPSVEVRSRIEPEILVMGDPAQLHQVVMSLCLNGSDGMPQGGTLSLRLFRGDPQHDSGPLERGRVVLEVEDTGVGLDEKTLERAFEPFATSRAFGRGTGLGLAMVHGITEAHGGTAEVESELGRGTLVRVFLPLAEDGRVETPPSTGAALESVTGRTLLIVDDDDLLRNTTGRLLRHLGFQVLEASGGRQALQLFEAHRADIGLVILDLVMPEMTGDETFHRLRAMDPNLRVVLMTGFVEESRARALLEAGARTLLLKPFEVHDLENEVVRHLST